LQSQTTSYNIAFASKKEYTLDGRLDKSSNVFNVLNTAAKINTQYAYDAQFGYVNSENYNNGVAITTHAVNGLTSTSTAPDGSVFEKTSDAIGNTIIAKDPDGAGGQNQITYEYDAASHPTKIINPSGTITMQYDAAGRQTQLTDPNAGTTQYAYNDFGELKSQTNATGLTTTLTYDDLGRPLTTTLPEGTITTTYDNKTNGKGMAGTITSNLAGFNNSINYTYDNLSRTTQTDEVIGSNTYTHKTVYDATTGRVNQTEYPSGFKLNYNYNSDGDVLKISRADNGKTIWEKKHIDDNGRMDEYYVGDAQLMVMKTTYDANQQLQNQSAKKGSTFLQNTDYGFSAQTGNLDMRYDNLNTTTTPKEFFGYDASQQLTKIEIGSTSSALGNSANSFVMQMDYDAKGNIIDKSDVGKYFYYHPQPNALTYVTHRNQTVTHTSPTDDYYRDVNAISNNQQDITYNSFEQPVTICENGNTLTLKYGIDKQRIQTILTDSSGGTTYQRTFVGDYEEETTSTGTRKIHYISGGSGGLVAVYIINANNVGTMYFVLKDHLGSITALVDESGNIVQRYEYTAWGKRSLTTDNTSTGKYILYRGYTGHEHLDEFALINMNGRLYDPVVGRMLSTDNYVQGGSQGFNRYSYVHNNPMKYTDPSGELILIDSWLSGFIGGWSHGNKNVFGNNGKLEYAWDESHKRLKNDVRLWGGLLATDPSKSNPARAWELISRFTWQLPQTAVGFLYTQGRNDVGRVQEVDYFHGASIAIKNPNEGKYAGSSVTMGSFITLANVKDDRDAQITIGDKGYTTMHEYGHYLQSKKSGPLYFFKYALPSAIGDADWTEIDANTRSAKYFHKIDNSFNWVEVSNDRYRILADHEINPSFKEYSLFFIPTVMLFTPLAPIGVVLLATDLTLITSKNYTKPW
jgi:RHS repeat-associated protein